MKKAVILLSGGLDSTTILHIAKQNGFECHSLSFSYGQRHNIELEKAKEIAKNAGIKNHKIAEIDLRIFGNSALTDEIDVPKNNEDLENCEVGFNKSKSKKIPITYVPARNTIFLSYAIALAETIEAFDIFIGVNAVDYSGYPDCRPEFIESFEKMANLATAITAQTNRKFKIHTPLINLSKSKIIKLGTSIGVDYSKTHSCYDPIIKEGKSYSCKKCDSCILRLEGFKNANIKDPIAYI
jgi:7-cyano-7-deazaguanine synthase